MRNYTFAALICSLALTCFATVASANRGFYPADRVVFDTEVPADEFSAELDDGYEVANSVYRLNYPAGAGSRPRFPLTQEDIDIIRINLGDEKTDKLLRVLDETTRK